MTILLTGLSAHGADEIKVSFEIGDGEHVQLESHVISAADCADLRLAKGDCTPAQYDAVAYAAALYGARKRGLSLLSFGRCSEKTLIRKLCARGIDREMAAEATASLSRDGYLNADADALAEAERGVAKLWGRRRIAFALREKGYSDDAIRDALCALEDRGVDFEENCAELIRRRGLTRVDDPKERQKQYAALARMGYTTEEIREAFRRQS